jgi:outer membrane protein OmpA-like peptidoglycan-associated protein
LNEQASSGPSTVYFDEGSTDLTDTGGIAAAAERWRDSEAEVRVVGYARILGEGRRAEALGTALQRANAVAAALVEAGVSAGDISVFANALEGGEEERRTRRVDIFLE